MTTKQRKPQRRRSTHQHRAAPIADESKIKCLFCGQSEEDVDTLISTGNLPEGGYDRWTECTACERWIHLECLDLEIGKQNTVSDVLWKKIRNFTAWNFTCPACGEMRPIPAQLEFQKVFSRDELLAMNISEELLLKRMPRDPSPEDSETTPRDGEVDENEMGTGAATSQNVLLNDNVAQQPETNSDGLAASEINQNPSGGLPVPPAVNQNPVGVFSASDMMQFFALMQKQNEQQQQLFFNKLFERESLERLERERERKSREEKEERDRQERDKLIEKLLQSNPVTSSESAIARKSATLQMPEIELPKFDGSILKWPEFLDLYENMIHKNDDLPKIQKFSFLKQCLSGSVASAIASYKITEANYDAAIDKLKDRFDNKFLITDQLFNQLQNLPVSGTKAPELRKNFDVITSICVQLRNLGENVDNNGMLLYNIMQKFPNSVRLRLNERKGKDPPWSLQLFLEYLEKHITNLEEIWFMRETESKGQKTERIWRPESEIKTEPLPRGSGANLMVNVNSPENTNRPTYPCAFCGAIAHYSAYCPDVTDVGMRKRILYNSKRCLLCLKPNHMKASCQHQNKSRQCPGCGQIGVHNKAVRAAFLQKVFPNQQAETAEIESNESQDTAQSAVVVLNKIEIEPETEPKSLLPMCTALVHANKNDELHTGRIFLDTGSNRTWINKDFAKKLKAEFKCTENVSVNTFGSIDPTTFETSKVEIAVMGPDVNGHGFKIPRNQIRLSAWTKPETLKQPIRRFKVPEKDLAYIKDTLLAVPAPDTIPDGSPDSLKFQPDIIIGADHYYDLYEQKAYKLPLPSGLKLDDTKLGYVLVGCASKLKNSEISYAAIAAQSKNETKQNMSFDSRPKKYTVPHQDNFPGGGSRRRRRRTKKDEVVTFPIGTYCTSSIKKSDLKKKESISGECLERWHKELERQDGFKFDDFKTTNTKIQEWLTDDEMGSKQNKTGYCQGKK